MESISGLVVIAPAALGIILILLLRKPIKLLLKLILHVVFGFLALAGINFLGGFVGITIGVNLLNALIVGILGVPGAALLLILRFLAVL